MINITEFMRMQCVRGKLIQTFAANSQANADINALEDSKNRAFKCYFLLFPPWYRECLLLFFRAIHECTSFHEFCITLYCINHCADASSSVHVLLQNYGTTDELGSTSTVSNAAVTEVTRRFQCNSMKREYFSSLVVMT